MQAQLPKDCSDPNIYLDSPEWGISQKIDGQRMILSIDSGKVTGYNRNGVQRDVPATISNYLKDMPVSFTLDGELLDDQYNMFDIISGTICSWQLERRYQLVCDLAERMDSNIIRKVSIHTLNKREIFDDLLYSNAEGVVFKKLSAPYKSGRNSNFIKYKFLNEVDCYVTELGCESKSNIVLSMWNGNEFIEVGKCSALTADGPSVKVGDVVTVTCLYATDSDRLYHTVMPRIRTDKLPQDCVIDQLELCRTNKEVRV